MCGSLTGLEVELGCGAWSVGRNKRDSSAGLVCLTSEVKLHAPDHILHSFGSKQGLLW